MDKLLAAARHAEAVGLDSIWIPEHVVFVAEATSQAIPTTSLASSTWASDPAPSTRSSPSPRLPRNRTYPPGHQHSDRARAQPCRTRPGDRRARPCCQGRFDFGIGVGWLREEFDAIGIPWAQRGLRTDDYLRAMDVLWQDELCSYTGPFVSFDDVQAWPKPIQQPRPPVWVGGNTQRRWSAPPAWATGGMAGISAQTLWRPRSPSCTRCANGTAGTRYRPADGGSELVGGLRRSARLPRRGGGGGDRGGHARSRRPGCRADPAARGSRCGRSRPVAGAGGRHGFDQPGAAILAGVRRRAAC